MKVFNPGSVPVVVDDGRVVPAVEHAEIPDGPVARGAVASGRLLDQTEPDGAAAEPKPADPAEKGRARASERTDR